MAANQVVPAEALPAIYLQGTAAAIYLQGFPPRGRRRVAANQVVPGELLDEPGPARPLLLDEFPQPLGTPRTLGPSISAFPSSSSADGAGAEEAASGGDPSPAAAGCLGCRRNRVQTDPEHSRIPGVCRYPHVETRVYDCPGCRDRAPTTSDRHTLVPGECRVPETRFRRSASAPASGSGSIRGARPPVASEPSSDMRPGAPAPDAPEESDPLPEAREAAAPRRPPAWSQPLRAARPPAGASAPMRNPAVEPPAAEGAEEEGDRPVSPESPNPGQPAAAGFMVHG